MRKPILNAQSTLKLICALLLAGLSIVQLQAVPTFRVFDSTTATTIDIADGGAGDLTPAGDGKVIVSGLVIGVWRIDVSSQTKDADGIEGNPNGFGTAAEPRMVFTTIDTSSSASGTLSIQFSETGFGPTPGGIIARVSGTFQSGLPGTSRYNTYGSALNTLFAHTTALTAQGPFATTTYDDTANGPSLAVLGVPFSLTQELLITHGAAGNSSHTARLDSVGVPEGGATLVLLGVGVTVLAMFGARRKSART